MESIDQQGQRWSTKKMVFMLVIFVIILIGGIYFSKNRLVTIETSDSNTIVMATSISRDTLQPKKLNHGLNILPDTYNAITFTKDGEETIIHNKLRPFWINKLIGNTEKQKTISEVTLTEPDQNIGCVVYSNGLTYTCQNNTLILNSTEVSNAHNQKPQEGWDDFTVIGQSASYKEGVIACAYKTSELFSGLEQSEYSNAKVYAVYLSPSGSEIIRDDILTMVEDVNNISSMSGIHTTPDSDKFLLTNKIKGEVYYYENVSAQPKTIRYLEFLKFPVADQDFDIFTDNDTVYLYYKSKLSQKELRPGEHQEQYRYNLLTYVAKDGFNKPSHTEVYGDIGDDIVGLGFVKNRAIYAYTRDELLSVYDNGELSTISKNSTSGTACGGDFYYISFSRLYKYRHDSKSSILVSNLSGMSAEKTYCSNNQLFIFGQKNGINGSVNTLYKLSNN